MTAKMTIAEARWESIKAGLIGALAVGLVAAIAWLVTSLSALPITLPSSLLAWFISLSVALCSGFFFGVTYRYILRQDDNLHLGSGAVGAFAFVRWHSLF